MDDDTRSIHSTQSGASELSESISRTVPQFLVKLFRMTNNEQHRGTVEWNEDGTSFWVADIAAFSRDVLPYYFKHNNYASFVRQLNMYGFHRSTTSKGKVVPGMGMIERFSNQYFRRGREDLLVHIRRKATTASKKTKAASSTPSMPTSEMASLNFQTQQASPMVESRIVALERQVQFLHLQNQALAQQSNRQQEALQHVMRVFTRLGISPEGDIPQHLSAFGSNSAWPMSGVGVGAQGSASAGQGFGNMGGSSMGGAGQGYAYNQQMSFGQQQQQQGGMQGGMMSRDPKGDRELAILVDDESMDIDAVLASMEQNPRDGFVSVS